MNRRTKVQMPGWFLERVLLAQAAAVLDPEVVVDCSKDSNPNLASQYINTPRVI